MTTRDGDPCGLRKQHDVIASLAADASLAQLEDAIDGGDVSLRLGALTIAAVWTKQVPASLFTTIAPWLASDERDEWSWGPRSYQKRVFTTADLASEAYAHLVVTRYRSGARRRLTRNADVTASQSEQTRIAVWLHEGLGQALTNRDQPQVCRPLLRAHRQVGPNPEARQSLAEIMARALENVATDASIVAELRWNALTELQRQQRLQPEPLKAPWHESCRRATRQALDEMGQADSDVRFVRLAAEKLADLAPASIADLQARGVLSAGPLPPPDELLHRWGGLRDDRVIAAVSRVSRETVLDALEGEDPEELISALCLLRAMEPRLSREEIAEFLLIAAQRDDHIALAQTRVGSSHTLYISELAGDQLARLVAPGIRKGDAWSVDLGLVALDTILDSQTGQRDRQTAARHLADAFIRSGQPLADKVRTHLDLVRRDTWRKAGARFVATLLLGDQTTTDWAVDTVLSTTENPALKALIGSRLFEWRPDELSTLLTQWQQGDPPLPLVEPRNAVPVEWLIEAIDVADQSWVRHRAIRYLANRIRPRAGFGASHAITQLRGLDAGHPLPQILRDLVGEPEDDIPAWSACLILAILGDPIDEARLVDFAVRRGAWSRLDPRSAEFANRDLAEHLTLDPLSYRRPYHMIEPFLLVGFGEEITNRLMAKVFVRLARLAKQRGLLNKAANAYRLAGELDALNLDVRRQRSARS